MLREDTTMNAPPGETRQARPGYRFACRLLCLLLASAAVSAPRDAGKPNVVLIMTDNHGAWTLGCYGNPAYTSVQGGLSCRLDAYFERVADSKWDLWKGGTSKSGLIMRKLFDYPGPWRPARE